MKNAQSNATLLLVEPQSLLRETVVGVARELRGIDLVAASGVPGATRTMREQRFDGLLLALDEAGEALDLLVRLRSSALACRSDLPVAVLATACDASTVARLKALDVRRVLLKPFRVRQVLETVERLVDPAPAGGGGAAAAGVLAA